MDEEYIHRKIIEPTNVKTLPKKKWLYILILEDLPRYHKIFRGCKKASEIIALWLFSRHLLDKWNG